MGDMARTTISGFTFGIYGSTGQRVTGVHTEDEAMALAADAVERMRQDGASSGIRRVAVCQRGDGDPLGYRRPPVFEASYFDADQGLTDTETYSARVHDWHAPVDAFNRRSEADRSTLGTGYRTWQKAWGPRPKLCPMCSRVF